MALIILDASVVIAVLDASDSLHTAALAALRSRAGDDLRLPISAYAEALGGPARQQRLDEARSKIEALFEIEPLSPAIAEQAAGLRARHPTVRLPDALVIATGERLRATHILTADQKWCSVSERVHLIN